MGHGPTGRALFFTGLVGAGAWLRNENRHPVSRAGIRRLGGTVNLSLAWPDFTDEDDFEQVSRPPVSDLR
jgi:hypothetical protein